MEASEREEIRTENDSFERKMNEVEEALYEEWRQQALGQQQATYKDVSRHAIHPLLSLIASAHLDNSPHTISLLAPSTRYFTASSQHPDLEPSPSRPRNSLTLRAMLARWWRRRRHRRGESARCGHWRTNCGLGTARRSGLLRRWQFTAATATWHTHTRTFDQYKHTYTPHLNHSTHTPHLTHPPTLTSTPSTSPNPHTHATARISLRPISEQVVADGAADRCLNSLLKLSQASLPSGAGSDYVGGCDPIVSLKPSGGLEPADTAVSAPASVPAGTLGGEEPDSGGSKRPRADCDEEDGERVDDRAKRARSEPVVVAEAGEKEHEVSTVREDLTEMVGCEAHTMAAAAERRRLEAQEGHEALEEERYVMPAEGVGGSCM